MTSIRITDQLGVDILTATAQPTSGLAKYFKGPAASFLASGELVAAFGSSVSSITSRNLGAALKFSTGGTFGSSDVDWKIGASAPTAVAVTQRGDQVPGDQLFLHPVVVPQDQSVVSASFSPSLSAGIALPVGDLRFGFDAGASVVFRAARSFEAGAEAPKLGDALLDLLANGIIPGNITDLQQMKPGDFGSVAGSGRLSVSGSFNVGRVVTPLVSPTLLLKEIGSIQVDAGGSLGIQASVGIRGMYQF